MTNKIDLSKAANYFGEKYREDLARELNTDLSNIPAVRSTFNSTRRAVNIRTENGHDLSFNIGDTHYDIPLAQVWIDSSSKVIGKQDMHDNYKTFEFSFYHPVKSQPKKEYDSWNKELEFLFTSKRLLLETNNNIQLKLNKDDSFDDLFLVEQFVVNALLKDNPDLDGVDEKLSSKEDYEKIRLIENSFRANEELINSLKESKKKKINYNL